MTIDELSRMRVYYFWLMCPNFFFRMLRWSSCLPKFLKIGPKLWSQTETRAQDDSVQCCKLHWTDKKYIKVKTCYTTFYVAFSATFIEGSPVHMTKYTSVVTARTALLLSFNNVYVYRVRSTHCSCTTPSTFTWRWWIKLFLKDSIGATELSGWTWLAIGLLLVSEFVMLCLLRLMEMVVMDNEDDDDYVMWQIEVVVDDKLIILTKVTVMLHVGLPKRFLLF